MKFITIIDGLVKSNRDNSIIRKNGTVLIQSDSVPYSRHAVFPGISDEIIENYLVSVYANPFPEQYYEFLSHYNGANLCRVKVDSKKGFSFAESLLTIYGLPRTPPFGRAWDMEEPFDVRIEDLSRHKKTPRTWLKFASYDETPSLKRIDCFVDTDCNRVYACPKDKKDVIREWDSIDECLVELYEELSVQPLRFDY